MTSNSLLHFSILSSKIFFSSDEKCAVFRPTLSLGSWTLDLKEIHNIQLPKRKSICTSISFSHKKWLTLSFLHIPPYCYHKYRPRCHQIPHNCDSKRDFTEILTLFIESTFIIAIARFLTALLGPCLYSLFVFLKD